MSSTKDLVASILNIPSDENWEVSCVLESEGLALAHHSKDADVVQYGWIKGIIVDLVDQKIVCRSFGASINVSLSMGQDITVSPQGTYRFVTMEGQPLNIKADRIIWCAGQDGTLVRVWKHDRTGKVYISSHKRIETEHPSCSWGGCPPFSQLYRELGGPTEELFSREDNPLVVYTFMIIHHQLQVATREIITKPRLVFMGSHNLSQNTETQWIEPEIIKTLDSPQNLSLQEANHFLRHGLYPCDKRPSDPRMTNGEFCMLFEFTDNTLTKIDRCIKVASDAYDWRVRMRANDPDLKHLVFSVASIKHRDLNTRNGYNQYIHRYLSIMLPSPQDLPYLYPVEIPREKIIEHQRETAVASLVFASPPAWQPLILQYFADYMMFVHDCTEWILHLYLSPDPQEKQRITESHQFGPHVIRRFENIIEVSRKQLRNELFTDMEDFNRRFRSMIMTFVENEYGDSLYKMYRVMYGC